MIDGFTYKGVWFLPNNPDNKITGILTFDPQEGIELELLGRLVELSSSEDIHEPKFILGFTTDGKLITLYKSFEFNRSMSLPGMETCKYFVNFILKGAHFKTESDFVFNSVIGRLKNLENWISEFVFKKVDKNPKTRTIKIKYKLPNPIEFQATPTLVGKFDFTYLLSFSMPTSETEIEQKATVVLETKTAKPFEELLDDFFHFQNFLTFGTFEASYPISISIKNNKLKESIGEEKVPIIIEVFFRPSVTAKPTRKKMPMEFLFNYKDIASNFSGVISKWYTNKEIIRPVTNLLFDSFYNAGKFTENNFLNICQAIETFHRRFRKNEVLPKEDYKKKIKEILDTVDPKHKDWLQDRLHFSNEPTLHMRLEELIDELTNKTLKKIIKDKNKFIKDIKNSRNYYTHYDRNLEKKAKKGRDLFRLTEKLKVLLICAVLKETGFTDEQIEKLLERNERRFFNYIIDG